MPSTDTIQELSASPKSSRFSILSRRQVHSMESSGQESVLDSFQRQVAERFQDLSLSDSDELLSIVWIRKLLDAFLSCQEDFQLIISSYRSNLNRPPMDRYVTEFYEKSVKALDVCNAIRDGIEQIRQWQKQLDIVLCALDSQRSIGEGHFRRAKKALVELSVAMLDDKDSGSASFTVTPRNRSFGRQSVGHKDQRSFTQFRSLSWSVSRSWSALKQLQAIGSLVAPRPNEMQLTNGLNVAVFTMSYVLFFVIWALVAAIPCQDRGLQTHFMVTRQFAWAGSILSLHERIVEESKKRDRRNACGLLKEILEIERCSRSMAEMIDSVEFPLMEEKEKELKQRVEEVRLVHEAIKDGLDPLELQVREVFHRIVSGRTRGLSSIEQN